MEDSVMDTLFVNLYIERLIALIVEQTKSGLIKDAQIAFLEKQLADANEKVQRLTDQQAMPDWNSSAPVEAPVSKVTRKQRAEG
jgi:hypothetical protein